MQISARPTTPLKSSSQLQTKFVKPKRLIRESLSTHLHVDTYDADTDDETFVEQNSIDISEFEKKFELLIEKSPKTKKEARIVLSGCDGWDKIFEYWRSKSPTSNQNVARSENVVRSEDDPYNIFRPLIHPRQSCKRSTRPMTRVEMDRNVELLSRARKTVQDLNEVKAYIRKVVDRMEVQRYLLKTDLNSFETLVETTSAGTSSQLSVVEKVGRRADSNNSEAKKVAKKVRPRRKKCLR